MTRHAPPSTASAPSRPLAGRRIIVTRAGAPGERLAALLTAAGAEAPHAPLTRIEMLDREGLAWRLASRAFDWVVFTSANAVRAAVDAATFVPRDAPPAAQVPVARPLAAALAGTKVAAVGRATAELLHDHGVAVEVVPAHYDAESLLDELSDRDDVRGARVLHPAAAGAREVLSEGLEALGAQVETAIVYHSVPDAAGARALREALATYRTDLVTFLAPSSVEAYVAALGEARAREVPAASIGPVTSLALRTHDIPIALESEEATASALVDRIVAHYIGDHGSTHS